MKGIIKKALIGLSFMSLINVANAVPVTWTLDSTQTGYSFAQTFGIFTFDADTNTYANVNMRFSTNVSLVFGINAGSDSANGFSYGSQGGTGIFTLNFDTPLSNAGGVVTGTGSNNVQGSPTYWSFSVHSPVTTPVPEPESFALIFAGLGLIGFAARRK